MKRFAILAAGAVLLSAQSAMADTCFVEEMSPSLKTFSFDNVDKNFREVVRNRLIVIAGVQAKNSAWPRSAPSATVTCFNAVDSAPTLLQKLEVYRDSRSNEFKVRETGL
ncbi:hypothetical protein [Rhizobium sp. MHM7A]|uniref:hypothetical protein n=1 Tax=Rhizobium sp. MHM7A TaxID=2583233 RepID=UPI0011068611|nr:hypothetical protein [Rhizobium sp. MHM7A]TLX16338.1 hypothetical protein FFR93_03130 [Rhizobium sp. MHM7A]